MKCPVCGKENQNNNLYCNSCGAKLDRQSQGPSKRRTINIVISALAIILLAEGIYLMSMRIVEEHSINLTTNSETTEKKDGGETRDSASTYSEWESVAEKQDSSAGPEVKEDPKSIEKAETNTDSRQKSELSEKHILPESEPNDRYYAFFRGHTYGFYDADDHNLKTYRMISDFCRDQGGHLAVMNDEEENQFLYNLAVQKYEYTTVFFGYTDKDEEGTWVWDGDDSDYTNWTRSGDWNLPDNGADWGGDEDFAEFNYDKYPKYGQPNDGTWNDAGFMENTTLFICEWEYDLRNVEK